MAMKGCELCDRPARMYCESDQASLCWECDARVHGANFLVARHARVLLCRRCQAPTPWRASGARLGPTFSVCDRCAGVGKISERDEGEGEGEEEREDVIEEDDSDDDSEDEGEDEDEDEEANGEEEEEDGDNQVVPWAMPPPASSSTSEDSSSKLCNGAPKRMRENTADPDCHQDNRTCSTSQPSYFVAAAAEDEATSFGGSFHPSKDRRRFGAGAGNGTPSTGALHIRNRRNIRSVDFVSSGSGSPPMTSLCGKENQEALALFLTEVNVLMDGFMSKLVNGAGIIEFVGRSDQSIVHVDNMLPYLVLPLK